MSGSSLNIRALVGSQGENLAQAMHTVENVTRSGPDLRNMDACSSTRDEDMAYTYHSQSSELDHQHSID